MANFGFGGGKIPETFGQEIVSDTWSSASLYSKSKIATLLIRLDIYENLALYGTDNPDEELMIPMNQMPMRRYNGLRRLCSTTRQLLGNVKFSIRTEDRPKLLLYIEQLGYIYKYLDGVIYNDSDMVSHKNEMKINEKYFNMCFSLLQKIKDDANTIINNAGLIFRITDEIDVDSLIRDIATGG